MAHDDRALLDLVGEVMGLLDIDEFRRGLLLALKNVLPSKWASLNDMGPDWVVAIAEPRAEPQWFDKFAEVAHENPIYQHLVRTGDGQALRFSDVAAPGELEATRLYREFYVPMGVDHQIAFTLPNGARGMLAVALSRGAEQGDYSDAERNFLNRARPYLIQAYRNASAYSREARESRLAGALEAEGLTAREAEVMRLVALGRSNADAASELDLSIRTVQKHVERAFRKLGTNSRSEAASRAWELASALELVGEGTSAGSR
jgi:DNA-binding NarL/FixJ family response regulator